MTKSERNAVVFAITGGIACGKSEVGRIVESMGFKVCDADRVAHGLMTKGSPVFQRVLAAFGETILAENGEISRPLLGKMVFERPDKLRLLNQLVHPAVRDELAKWISERRALGEHGAIQIPLLFESGMETLDWDAVVCVSSAESQVLARLERRGLGHADALKRIEVQMPLADKERRSDGVIRNLGTLQELEEATRAAVNSLLVER